MIVVVFLEEDEVFLAEVSRDLLPCVQHPSWPRADNALDASQHALDMLVVEQNILGPQFGKDAAQTPNVNLLVVIVTEDHLRSTVAARLDIGA